MSWRMGEWGLGALFLVIRFELGNCFCAGAQEFSLCVLGGGAFCKAL